MSSEMFVFENFFLNHLFSPFTDSSSAVTPRPFENLGEIQGNRSGNKNTDDETSSVDQIASLLLLSSPESFNLDNVENSVFSGYGEQSFDSAVTLMQKSYSSNSFENEKCPTFRPPFDALLESQNLQNQTLVPPESRFCSGHMRRVYSTGDLQNVKTNMEMTSLLSSSSSFTEKSSMEEANLIVRRYSAEERKERIDRYRAKRIQRNFTKTIKYACRKTLADNRLRVRGRFARNDEIPKASMFHQYEDAYRFLKNGFQENPDEATAPHWFGSASEL